MTTDLLLFLLVFFITGGVVAGGSAFLVKRNVKNEQADAWAILAAFCGLLCSFIIITTLIDVCDRSFVNIIRFL